MELRERQKVPNSISEGLKKNSLRIKRAKTSFSLLSDVLGIYPQGKNIAA